MQRPFLKVSEAMNGWERPDEVVIHTVNLVQIRPASPIAVLFAGRAVHSGLPTGMFAVSDTLLRALITGAAAGATISLAPLVVREG